MNDNKSRDIFYGVVAVATLIVALVGATLAYFSISASSNEGAVNAQAATVSIEYSDGQQVSAQADKLIPATLSVVQTMYEKWSTQEGVFGSATALESNVCLDDKNQQVCSIYRFSVRSAGGTRTISATLNNEHNGFSFLSYAVRDVTNNTWLTLDDAGNKSLAINSCDNNNFDENQAAITQDDCSTTSNGIKTYALNASNSIFGKTGTGLDVSNTTKEVGDTAQVYDLVLFIAENNQNQNIDQGQEYKGTIIVDVMDGGLKGQISGYVNETN